MFEVKHPYFKKNRILKIEMLELLRDFPKDVLHVYLEDCSDGIIQGLKPIVKENMISFSKGVVKHHKDMGLVNEVFTGCCREICTLRQDMPGATG